jgi:hypothetical protein
MKKVFDLVSGKSSASAKNQIPECQSSAAQPNDLESSSNLIELKVKILA